MNATQESAGTEPRCAHARMTHSEPRGHYSRLFARPAKPVPREQEDKLIELGKAMRYTIEREGTLTPRVGYTYFGQFVGHDLTHDSTPLEGPYAEPELTPNYRTPCFDLITSMEEVQKSHPFFMKENRERNPSRWGRLRPKVTFAICRSNMEWFLSVTCKTPVTWTT
jgi:hypothetical protein